MHRSYTAQEKHLDLIQNQSECCCNIGGKWQLCGQVLDRIEHQNELSLVDEVACKDSQELITQSEWQSLKVSNLC